MPLNLVYRLGRAHVSSQHGIAQSLFSGRNDGEEGKSATISGLDVHSHGLGVDFDSVLNQVRQRFHRSGMKQGRKRDLFAGRSPDLRQQSSRQERMASEIEEVIQNADRIDIQNLLVNTHQQSFV